MNALDRGAVIELFTELGTRLRAHGHTATVDFEQIAQDVAGRVERAANEPYSG